MMRAGHTSKFISVVSVLCMGIASQAHAADTGKNEYLDMDIAQLMNITVTSVARKSSPCPMRLRRCSSSPRKISAAPE